MHIRLPDSLPSAGLRAELRFRRMPLKPCVLRVRSPGAGSVAQFDMYARGETSKATQDVDLNVRLDAATIAEHGLRGGDALELVTESLDGHPWDPASVDLDLVGVTFWSL